MLPVLHSSDEREREAIWFFKEKKYGVFRVPAATAATAQHPTRAKGKLD